MPNPSVQPFAVRSRQRRLAAGMIAAALLVLAGPAIGQTPPAPAAQPPAAKTAPAPAPPTRPAPAAPQAAPAAPAATQPAPTLPPKAAAEAAPQAVPGFWDPRRRPDRPDLSRLTVIRFLTETDYPPFNFTGPDGNPAGFNVDLARSLCDEIKVTCTIQMRRFETLIDALATNRGDAIIASMAVTPQLRAKVDFTDPYYRAPARFVSRRDNVMPEIRPEYLEGKKVGVIAGTSHEAYLKAMFTDAEIHSYPDNDALRAALRRGEVDFIFGDAISLAFWINGTDSAECCAFSGGPFVESRYFGEGVGIAVRKGNDLLRQSLNWALFRIWEKGRFTDLWLRYFSVSPF
ncbi:transporter substrate-binding domain-containing protein [Bradyrhizobium elkanii]|uniref:transporter substrate-binding domain-containing protein n=1 Tax=Bradyrhizobium elkanii TaxID=29448 RepID=UPI0005700DE3|nr:transporter substrate-binding domain-containing protein [Bradyrhizobium elkanii]WLA82288.1 transporter substrate-binding domain-containing protein [Bradyrhizobium elkanii]